MENQCWYICYQKTENGTKETIHGVQEWHPVDWLAFAISNTPKGTEFRLIHTMEISKDQYEKYKEGFPTEPEEIEWHESTSK